jgi:cell division protein FtsX
MITRAFSVLATMFAFLGAACIVVLSLTRLPATLVALDVVPRELADAINNESGIPAVAQLSSTIMVVIAVSLGLVGLLTVLEDALQAFNRKLAASLGTDLDTIAHANRATTDTALQNAVRCA